MKLLTAKDFGLTIEPIYVERMKLACEYVENNVTDENFALDEFRSRKNDGWDTYVEDVLSNNPSCGTVGCFVGHAIHTITDKDHVSKLRKANSWADAALHLCGVDYWVDKVAWHYLFGEFFNTRKFFKLQEYADSENIESIHNSRLGTIERIRHFYGIEE